MPGLSLVSSRRSALRSAFADGFDRLTINLGGDALATQGGHEFVLKRGDAAVFTGSDLGSLTTRMSGRVATIHFTSGSLQRLVRDSARHITAAAPPLLLLRRYLNAIMVADLREANTPRAVAIEHIQDLAALALGARAGAEDVTSRRGVAAARMQAIKEEILRHLAVPLNEVAAKARISPRYLRKLFEREGSVRFHPKQTL